MTQENSAFSDEGVQGVTVKIREDASVGGERISISNAEWINQAMAKYNNESIPSVVERGLLR